MYSKQQSSNSLFATIEVAATATLVAAILFALAAVPALGQSAVPPTARQAAESPAFASRLHPPAGSAHLQRPARPRRTLASPQDQVLYDNGPYNGTTDAWTINFGFSVSDSFTGGNITGLHFVYWDASTSDLLTSVDMAVGSSSFGGTFQTLSGVTNTFLGTNQYGYALVQADISVPGVQGSGYITLQNACTTSGCSVSNPVYWDENSGAGCQSSGCPSTAYENTLGSIPSEAFTVTGSGRFDCSGPPVLHHFTREEGGFPTGVAMDGAGNLDGTTYEGGAFDAGIAFRLSQAGSDWTFNTLYTFPGGANGSNPTSPIIGPYGNLYLAANGGVQNCNGQYCGEVIRLRPSPTACLTALCSWSESVLYQFAGGADAPGTISAIDAEGNLYGSEAMGGDQRLGVVFELTPSIGYWTKTILYSFTGGDDGYSPGAVLLGTDGNLYGRALGGVYRRGVIFQLARSSSGWTENTIVALSEPDHYVYLYPDLVEDASGNFYFTSAYYWTDYWGWYVDGTVNKLAFVDGQWNVTMVLDINPFTFDAAVDLYDLSADRGDVYAAADSYTWDCTDPPCFVMNEIVDERQDVRLGKDFRPTGPMASDAQGNLYGAAFGCGGDYGKIWKLSR